MWMLIAATLSSCHYLVSGRALICIGVAAQEIDLDLHGVAEPSEDVDVVPTLFVISARRVVVDADLVAEVAVKLGVQLRLQDLLQHTQFRLFLGAETSQRLVISSVTLSTRLSLIA